MQSIDASTEAWSTGTGVQRSVALAVFLLLPLASLYSSAGGLAFWALALLGVWQCLSKRGRLGLSQKTWKLLLLAFLLPVLLNLASVLYFGLPARRLSWIPFVGALFIVFAVLDSGISVKPVVMGATLASFVLLFITALALIGYGHERPSLTMNALLYGKLSIVSMLITAWGLGDEKNRKLRALMFLSLLAGLAALMFTGYRGGWLALPLILIALLINPRAPANGSLAKMRPKVFAIVLAVLTVTIMSANYSAVERVQKLVSELQAYDQGVVNNSSVGSRIAMWKSAAQMFSERPVFGIGAQEYHLRLQQMQEQGSYPADAKLYRHAHNSFLNIAAEYGSIGLFVMSLALIGLFWLSLTLSNRYRQLCLLLLGCWILMALTNDVFAHQSLLRVMTFGFAVSLGLGLRSD